MEKHALEISQLIQLIIHINQLPSAATYNTGIPFLHSLRKELIFIYEFFISTTDEDFYSSLAQMAGEGFDDDDDDEVMK